MVFYLEFISAFIPVCFKLKHFHASSLLGTKIALLCSRAVKNRTDRPNKQTSKQTDWQIDQTNKQTNRLTDRPNKQTNRLTDRPNKHKDNKQTDR